MHFADRAAHVMGGSLFEQKSHCARVGGVFDIRVIIVRGKHEHLGRGDGFEYLTRGLQTIEQGHGDVHRHHTRTQFHRQPLWLFDRRKKCVQSLVWKLRGFCSLIRNHGLDQFRQKNE
jgi:hypothetical protein